MFSALGAQASSDLDSLTYMYVHILYIMYSTRSPLLFYKKAMINYYHLNKIILYNEWAVKNLI